MTRGILIIIATFIVAAPAQAFGTRTAKIASRLALDSTAQLFDGQAHIQGCRLFAKRNGHYRRAYCNATIKGNYCLKMRVWVLQTGPDFATSGRILGRCQDSNAYFSAVKP
jgi:hypothetical protein